MTILRRRRSPARCVSVRLRSRLRREIDCRPQAAVHVEGHGIMLVHDLPRAGDTAEADRLAEPQIVPRAVGLGAVQPHEAIAEGGIAADDDPGLAKLVAERALPGCEP